MRKTLLLLALASVSAFLVVACSSTSSSPIDPDPGEDLIAPAMPSDLSIELYGDRVHLVWAENSESDLAGYRVYRTSGGASAYALGDVPSAKYFERIETSHDIMLSYRVTAIDQSLNESGYSQEVQILYSVGNTDAVGGKDEFSSEI